MPRVDQVIEVNKSEAELLEKINITHRTIELQIPHLASDLQVLHYLNSKYLLNNLGEILHSERPENQKKECLKQILAQRWMDIKGTKYSYCEQPRDLFNQLCLAVALYISPLPEDLSDCDDWQVGQGPYFVLMPTLEACNDIVLNSNIHQYQLQEFILSEDNKRYIPVYDVLNFYFHSTALKPVHMVFSNEQMDDPQWDKKDDALTESEHIQLKNHSELTTQILNNLEILKDPNGSFFNRISELADGLFAGSSHGGSGTGDNAAPAANEAIIKFFEYWDGLTEDSRKLYLRLVPNLTPIFKRLRDPVAIASQGVNYCVGLTGGELRFIARENRNQLQSEGISKLQEAVRGILNTLETVIKQAKYKFNVVQKDAEPQVYEIINIHPNEQSYLINTYLNMDYPNFLFYAFDQQPKMVPLFMEAFQKSRYKSLLLQQQSLEGMTLLMRAAQCYPEALKILLVTYLELPIALNKEEVIIIAQRHPEALAQLLAVIAKLERNEQLHFLIGKNACGMNLMISALETNPTSFLQICELINTYPVDVIEQILEVENHKGNSLLMLAFLDYPYAVAPLLSLFERCHEQKKNNWLSHCNKTGLNLVTLALNYEVNVFRIITNAAVNMPFQSLRMLIRSNQESFLVRASQSQVNNLARSLSLVDQFPLEEQHHFILERDNQNNNLLLSILLHQPIPPSFVFNKLSQLPARALFNLLNTKNHEGFYPLTLALTQQPQYFVYIVELIALLPAEQQSLVWQQVDVNGHTIPLLAVMNAPEHLPTVLDHVSESAFFASLKKSDHNGNYFLHLIIGFQPGFLSLLIAKIKQFSLEERFQLLRQCNQQGDNLLLWILFQDRNLLGHLFELMQGFTLSQQLALITQRNHQNQHALTVAYSQDIELLNQILRLMDEFNTGKNNVILTNLPLPHWFDLLSSIGANSILFERFYAAFRTLKQNDGMALGNLLNYHDAHNNNLMMLILRHNPSLVNFIIRDVKSLSDEKIQRSIMLQTNRQGDTVLSLAERYSTDAIASSLQAFLKRLDKQSTKQMILQGKIKMYSETLLISFDRLEDYDAKALFQKLDERDEDDTNLLGQIIIHMPQQLHPVIKKMQELLSPHQIIDLFSYSNKNGFNCYALASKQDQAAYLCNQIQSVLNQWVDKIKEHQHLKLMDAFLNEKSDHFELATANGNLNVCQRFIRATNTLSIPVIVAIMLRNKQAVMMGLTSARESITGLFNQWLLSLPPSRRWEVLSHYSAEFLLSLLDKENTSVFDALPLNYQAQLLSIRDESGQNILVKSLSDAHSCSKKLIKRFKLFTSAQQTTLLQARGANQNLLHVVADNSLLFMELLSDVMRLSNDTQLALLSQVDQHNLTVLDYLGQVPDLYEQVLNLYDNLGLKKQIQLYIQPTGPKNACLLLNAPMQFKQRIVLQLLTFPQEAKITIFLDMIQNDSHSLKELLDNLPNLQMQVLEMIQLFPKPVLGALAIPRNTGEDSLFRWMINSPYHQLRERALSLMSCLAKMDLCILFKHKNSNGDNLLQEIAKEFPSLFKPAFSIFMNLCTESKIDLLLCKNTNGKNLFSDLVEHKCFDHFEHLCKTLSQFPNDKKVEILAASGIVPTERTTRWVNILYDAPQSRAFIKLLNNKCFFTPMFRLLQSLAPQVQITILTNSCGSGRRIVDEIMQPEQSQLKLLLKHAYALVKAEKLLNKMGRKIPNEQVFSPENCLHQKLSNRLAAYQNTYHKSIKHMDDLAAGWISDIETEMPLLKTRYSSTNVMKTVLKLSGSVIIPPYGGYNLYKKLTTNRHILFRSDQQRILYEIEDLGIEFKEIGKASIEKSFG